VFTASVWRTFGIWHFDLPAGRRQHVLKMGCSPSFPEALNLINNINRGEIVKNFTNFACGAGAGTIKFPRSSNRFVSAA
jgi:hypothetical protein